MGDLFLPSDHMNTATRKHPRCIIIAGCNGSGKTTFARSYLQKEQGVVNFVNADLIAAGLSPLNPELAAHTAGKLVLTELDRLASDRVDFAFETTLSGRAYANRIKKWKTLGYRVRIVFLCIDSKQLALRRIANRVKHGGHNVPRADVLRRFKRGWNNFINLYQPLADSWAVYDNSSMTPVLIKEGP